MTEIPTPTKSKGLPPIPCNSPSIPSSAPPSEVSSVVSSSDVLKKRHAQKSTLRICEEEPKKQVQMDNTEKIIAVCEISPREECELTVKPERDEVIDNVNTFIISCDDAEFGLYYYMKPLKDGDKVVGVLLKNATDYKRSININCVVSFV